MSNSLFRNNDHQSALIGIDSVFYVEISECEFYQNKDQDDLVWISSEQVHNLTMSNCLFRNNDAQLALLIDSVYNVEISGCEFYQNKGQDDHISIGLEHVHNLTISNCLFRDNDGQSALILIVYVLNVEKYLDVNSIKTKVKMIL